jgi:mannose-1-phosphate guanylyltransferase
MTRKQKREGPTDVRVVILAGGSGTRFWPLGRDRKPKQFIPISGRRTMIEDTVARIRPLVPLNRIWTVADSLRTRALRKVLPQIPKDNFLVEPTARNTGPALMMATARAWLENPAAVVVALPADHLIRDRKRFQRKLKAAVKVASREKALVTFGIPPTYPATGYGYIRFSRAGAVSAGGEAFYPALSFKEKPSLGIADRYLAQGDSFWNSGMFVWEAEAFAREIETHAPEIAPGWGKMVRALERGGRSGLVAAFRNLPALSIDYALMEKAGKVLVCEGDFGWSDVGAWSSLLEIWPRDSHGNVTRGRLLPLESRNCLVHNPGKLTALVGVRDLLIVDTEDALLVCSVDRDQRVKEVVETLRKTNRKKYL